MAWTWQGTFWDFAVASIYLWTASDAGCLAPTLVGHVADPPPLSLVIQ